MAADLAYQAGSFSLSDILDQGTTAIKRNPVVILGIAFLSGTVPNLLFAWAVPRWQAGALSNGAISAIEMITALLVVLIVALIGQAALVHATAVHRRGQEASFGQAIGAGLRSAGPLLLLGIVMTLGLGIAFGLLVIPGIILSLMWSVAAPALIIEREGVFSALGRSRELTKGARWKILGFGLLLVIVLLLLSFLAGLIGGLLAAVTRGLSLLNMLPSAILQTVMTAYTWTLLASLFLELRDWKEGPENGALVDIFA